MQPTLTFLVLAVFLTEPFSPGSTLFMSHLHIQMTRYIRSLGCKAVNSKQWNVKLLLWFPLKLTCQLCLWLEISWGSTYLHKKGEKHSDEEWIEERQPERERNWKPKTEGERDTDKCAFEDNISGPHGTQADLSPPSSRKTHLSRWKQEPLWGGALALSLHPASSNWKT